LRVGFFFIKRFFLHPGEQKKEKKGDWVGGGGGGGGEGTVARMSIKV